MLLKPVVLCRADLCATQGDLQAGRPRGYSDRRLGGGVQQQLQVIL